MTSKLSISVTDAHARMIEDAVNSGQYASASEFIREALRRWSANLSIDYAIEEGLASGFSEPNRPIERVIAAARKSAKKKPGR